MLTLTENATLVIKSITGVEGAPEGAGVRISQENPADPALAVTTTEAPRPGDQVVEEAGARVFLEQNAANALDDKILDAAVDDKGGVEFLLVPQPGAGRENGRPDSRHAGRPGRHSLTVPAAAFPRSRPSRSS